MNIVGYRSPFKKKNSPAKSLATVPVTTQLLFAGASGLLSAAGSLFGSSRRRREQRLANEEFQKRKQAFESIEYVNPYANLTNPYANLQNPYAENLYEDLGVNMQSAQFLKEQQQQSQANFMQQFRGAAGGSGIGALAQSMSNIASGQARQASVDIARQERANELARIKGEQQKRTGQFGVDKLSATAQFTVDKLQAQGENYRRRMENLRTQNLFGLSIDRKMAADQARQAARSQFISGIGTAAAGVAGLYAPGGMRSGKFGEDLFKVTGGRLGNMPDVTVPVDTGPVLPNPNEQNPDNIINTSPSGLQDTLNFPNELNQTVQDNPVTTTTNLGVNDNMSFDEAFATARRNHGGPGGTFTWQGGTYGTLYETEVNGGTSGVNQNNLGIGGGMVPMDPTIGI